MMARALWVLGTAFAAGCRGQDVQQNVVPPPSGSEGGKGEGDGSEPFMTTTAGHVVLVLVVLCQFVVLVAFAIRCYMKKREERGLDMENPESETVRKLIAADVDSAASPAAATPTGMGDTTRSGRPGMIRIGSHDVRSADTSTAAEPGGGCHPITPLTPPPPTKAPVNDFTARNATTTGPAAPLAPAVLPLDNTARSRNASPACPVTPNGKRATMSRFQHIDNMLRDRAAQVMLPEEQTEGEKKDAPAMVAI